VFSLSQLLQLLQAKHSPVSASTNPMLHVEHVSASVQDTHPA